MKNLYYVIYNERTQETIATLGNNHTFYNDTWSPCDKVICSFYLSIRGKTYQEKKNHIQALAIEWSNNQAPGLDWVDLSIIYNFFEKYGRRYGLVKEFKENCII